MLRSAQHSVVEVFGRLLGHEVDEVCDLMAEVPVRSCEQTNLVVGLFEQLFQFLVGWFVCVAHTFDHRHRLEDVKSFLFNNVCARPHSYLATFQEP